MRLDSEYNDQYMDDYDAANALDAEYDEKYDDEGMCWALYV